MSATCFTAEQSSKKLHIWIIITGLKKEQFSSYDPFSDTDEVFVDCLNNVKIMKLLSDMSYSGEI